MEPKKIIPIVEAYLHAGVSFSGRSLPEAGEEFVRDDKFLIPLDSPGRSIPTVYEEPEIPPRPPIL
jgi:hypothetical protein